MVRKKQTVFPPKRSDMEIARSNSKELESIGFLEYMGSTPTERWTCCIQFKDGSELKISSNQYGEIEGFITRWEAKAWKSIHIYDRS